MGWQPGQGSGRGGEAGPNPGLPAAHSGSGSGSGGAGLLRDERLAGFAPGGVWDECPPSAALAAVLERASGEQWHCPGATHDELIGLLRQWAALESRAAAGQRAEGDLERQVAWLRESGAAGTSVFTGVASGLPGRRPGLAIVTGFAGRLYGQLSARTRRLGTAVAGEAGRDAA